MPPSICALCNTNRALILRPKNHQKLCKPCFLRTFETEIHHTITSHHLFHRGERIAIGASGGKDSTVLASVLKTLNERYDYGVELLLLSIDEGIKGYRDDSLETVKRNAKQYDMPLTILGYEELYGWTMDQVVEQVGKKGNCTYCGVFRRQALDRGAARLGVQHVVTGHNADDVAETVLMNLLRGDLPRLSRTTSIITSTPSLTPPPPPSSSPPSSSSSTCHTNIKRSKPLKYAYEKEIVLYAHHKNLDYFSTECLYSPEAFRGSARALIKNLERIRPSAILDVVRSGEDMAKLVPGGNEACGNGCTGQTIVADEGEGGCGSANGRSSGGEMASMEMQLVMNETAVEYGLEVEITSGSLEYQTHNSQMSMLGPLVNGKKGQRPKGPAPTLRKAPRQTMGQCKRCGYLSSQDICKACVLLEGLNKSRPKNSIEISSAVKEPQESQTISATTSIQRLDLGAE
ncbi:adenine nucleotide alpha hydrolases-like protein [Lepidopterella palustris CBS 459.81]|uniref:Cytoplasmic tRNA 2-thiolation protein 1 n=1 Tax=Lepidopterella palustris CBS 459.81 TaxID=1314670 RepID=A0A8E2JG22_9PEZI|nr:adenine nucleotide alpha hydrolases-like protein [Lepidopterella palustris CBS 459.81]